MTGAGSYGRRGGRSRVAVLIGVFVVGVAVCLAAIGPRFISDDEPRGRIDRQPQGSATSTSLPSAVEPGPTERIEGMPAGFARSEDGAAAAGSAFATIADDLLAMDPLAIEDAIRQIATVSASDDLAERMVGNVQGLRQALASGTGPLQYWAAALAVRVEEYDDGRARVAVWNVGVLSREQIAPPQAGWVITTFELVWERGDWRVESVDDVAGPVPIIDDSAEPATSTQLTDRLDGFVPLLAGPPAEGGR